MALQRQMESSQQKQTRLQDISARKAISSQLETLKKRAIIGERSEPLSRVFNDQPSGIYGGIRTYVRF